METPDGGHLDSVLCLLQCSHHAVHRVVGVYKPLADLLVVGGQAGEHLNNQRNPFPFPQIRRADPLTKSRPNRDQ